MECPNFGTLTAITTGRLGCEFWEPWVPVFLGKSTARVEALVIGWHEFINLEIFGPLVD
jgi:hypothetical protein